MEFICKHMYSVVLVTYIFLIIKLHINFPVFHQYLFRSLAVNLHLLFEFENGDRIHKLTLKV